MTSRMLNDQPEPRAFIITGPTSGIGRSTAFELARYGTVVLVGRDPVKLGEVQKAIEEKGGRAVSILCDLANFVSVRRATAEIVALHLPIAGLLNNAGIQQQRATTNALGWDMSFATNHLGPFVLTEGLMPHLADATNILFVASAVEDPERKPARIAGFRGGRYLSAEASARGEWAPGGSKVQGFDAYATSKQCTLATAFEFARENPRLRINAIEPGFMPVTGLGRDAPAFVRLLAKYLLGPIVARLKYGSTPQRAAQVITRILTEASAQTGIYYDEKGEFMLGSTLVRDPQHTRRIVEETRALLATIQSRQTPPDIATSPGSYDTTSQTERALHI